MAKVTFVHQLYNEANCDNSDELAKPCGYKISIKCCDLFHAYLADKG